MFVFLAQSVNERERRSYHNTVYPLGCEKDPQNIKIIIQFVPVLESNKKSVGIVTICARCIITP